MTRLKVHHLVDGGLRHAVIAAKLDIGVRSVERIAKEPAPTAEELVSGKRAGRRGRPSKTAPYEARVLELLIEEPETAPIEVLRRMRGVGYDGGRSAMFELVARVRPPPRPKEPVVRFEGLPGEFAQFDFGEAIVKFAEGERKVVFFAGRLKYSRFLHVVLVPDQRAEQLIRALVACLVAFGGSPSQWVFDNAKTIRISPIGAPLRLHAYLRGLVAEMNVAVEMCAPRSGNQKGSVENLVGFVKHGFLYARRFVDDADLAAQLAEWLHQSNHVRPCDATREIPEARRQREATWLVKRPAPCDADEYALRETRTITPMGTVNYGGTSYSTPPERIGAPATLYVRSNRIDMEAGTAKWSHLRKDGVGGVRRLPEHRRDVLDVLHGERKKRYFRRQCLLELGTPAHDFLEQLVHACPNGAWSPHVDTLYGCLVDYGGPDLTAAFDACVRRREFTATAVTRELRRAA